MRDWRRALQSGTMRNVVVSMLLLDAAGIYLVQRGSGSAVDDDPVLGPALGDAPAVAVSTASEWLPAPLPRPQATVRVEFSDIPAAGEATAGFDGWAQAPAMPPALSAEEFRPEPLELASDEDAQPVAREVTRRPAPPAISLPAPDMRRPATASATAFATTFPQIDTRGADTRGPDAPSIAVDQTVYWGASPATISGHPVTAGGLDEQAPAVVDGTPPEVRPSVDDARAGEVAAGSADRVPQDTASDVELRAELPA